MMMPERFGGSLRLLAGVQALTADRRSVGFSGGFDTSGRGKTVLLSDKCVIREAPVGIDAEWHTIRLEVHPASIRFLVDRSSGVRGAGGQFAGIGTFGIASSGAAWRLRALRVVTLWRGAVRSINVVRWFHPPFDGVR